MSIEKLLINAKKAKKNIAFLTNDEKNNILLSISKNLVLYANDILKANSIDVEKAKNTINETMIDRLSLNKDRIVAMAKGVSDLIELKNPVGVVLENKKRPNGMHIEKVTVPMGVIAMIYESRPNVTSDAAALCIKSGNVAVLRGGKEAIKSNSAIANIIRNTLDELGYDKNIVSFVEDTNRNSVTELMQAKNYIDLLIPRGGAGLIKACVEGAKVPCIETGTGICHLYIDKYANLDMAIKILENAKTQRPSVCNACEVCLVNEDVAKEFLPMIKNMAIKKNVELRLCEKSVNIIQGEKASENDFDTEFLDYILAVKIVKDVKEAINHISIHSTGHSESIITDNSDNANEFLNKIDSAAVYHNTSTRFTDGGEFGLGCEIGISTQKVGARGPMGLAEIVSYKYIIKSNGLIR